MQKSELKKYMFMQFVKEDEKKKKRKKIEVSLKWASAILVFEKSFLYIATRFGQDVLDRTNQVKRKENISEYSEPLLQRQHLFPKILPLK